MQRFYSFHLHGDNIVECERTIALIRKGLGDIAIGFRGPFGSSVCPSYELTLRGLEKPLQLTLLPGFGRWNQDILESIRQNGGTLRETPDMIITGVAEGIETPLLAIEYCGALPAGNQAWQRSGRAYSFGKAEVPYLYVAELGGYELGKNRTRKAARLPNPAIPFSYVSFSLANGVTVLPVFVTGPGAHESSRSAYATVFGEQELSSLVGLVIQNKNIDRLVDALRLKALAFVEIRAARSRAAETLTPECWKRAYESLLQRETLVDFLAANEPLQWSKTAYIAAITASRGCPGCS